MPWEYFFVCALSCCQKTQCTMFFLASMEQLKVLKFSAVDPTFFLMPIQIKTRIRIQMLIWILIPKNGKTRPRLPRSKFVSLCFEIVDIAALKPYRFIDQRLQQPSISPRHGLINYKDTKAKYWTVKGLCGRFLSYNIVKFKYSIKLRYFPPCTVRCFDFGSPIRESQCWGRNLWFSFLKFVFVLSESGSRSVHFAESGRGSIWVF